jgi:hypothetical protein
MFNFRKFFVFTMSLNSVLKMCTLLRMGKICLSLSLTEEKEPRQNKRRKTLETETKPWKPCQTR